MAQTYWTLEYPAGSGNEKSFVAWGFTDPRLRLVSQAKSTFTVRVLGAASLVANPPIPFKGQVIIRRNRSGVVFGGGEIVFQGRQVTTRANANSESPANTLIFADAWYDLENIVFQQQWNFGATQSTALFSRLNLFQRHDAVTGIQAATNGLNIINITLASGLNLNTGDYVTLTGIPGIYAPVQVTIEDPTHFSVPGQLPTPYVNGGLAYPMNQRITNGGQIQQIIAFAQACGVNIQPGTIDLNYTLPIYPVKAVSCATAMQICIKPQPDAVAWIDYSVTPPRFNCRARANLVQAVMPYGLNQIGADFGAQHTTSDITPRYDLQPPAVVLQYQKTSLDNGLALTDSPVDAYPPNSTGQQIGSLVVPIDLRGANIQSLSILVKSAALPNLAAGDAPSIQWWQNKKKDMQAYLNLQMVPQSLTVTDDNQNDLTQTFASLFPNEYQSGEILTWMGVTVQLVKVSALFTYDEQDSANRTTFSNQHLITVRVKLTNSPAGNQI